MLKAVNFVRLLSIIIFLGTLSVVYAYLDPVVIFSLKADMPTMHRTYFFYLGSLLFLVINILLWLLIKIIAPLIVQKFGLLLAGWFAALPVVVNFYICFLIGFLGVLNNTSSLELSNYVYLNFLGPILLLIWMALAIYFMSTKKWFH
tara:strand:+ start:1609 stop:2049 length:441 start_codon:yes stop_codon:yes gene_type:complete